MDNYDPSRDPVSRGSSLGTQAQNRTGKETRPAEDSFFVPELYGDHKIVLMVRDPWTVYSFWEVDPEKEDQLRKEMESSGTPAVKRLLRVYDVSGGRGQSDWSVISDHEIGENVRSWYVHGDPGRECIASVGFLSSTGEFFSLIVSNAVKTPSNRMSDVSDHDWMCPEELYYRMYAASGGDGVGRSSLSFKEILERFLRKWMFSGSLSGEDTTSSLFGSASFFLQQRKKK